jgi:hypothetical protein
MSHHLVARGASSAQSSTSDDAERAKRRSLRAAALCNFRHVQVLSRPDITILYGSRFDESIMRLVRKKSCNQQKSISYTDMTS